MWMIQSRTGSGKTGAYLLPIMKKVDLRKNVAQALVLVPTRELALQVSREAELLCEGTQLRTAWFTAASAITPSSRAFRNGAQLVVGTRGAFWTTCSKNP
jgi:ATP-dependent RNA helicase DeaD